MSDPAPLASYACRSEESRGRRYPEPESPTRSPFQRDRDRVIHSTAFRRLQYKTQVFVYHEGDHYRTRLTHSLEVAQIARSIARALRLNEDLAEALALAHDLGHTPFGHAGGDALDEAMRPYGGFEHNDQTFRVLTKLERHYADFDGLNLTWETLEGVVKHNGPLRGTVPPTIANYVRDHDLALDTYPSAEAQIAALSDDIAYNNHDLDP
jgi:dGTPase